MTGPAGYPGVAAAIRHGFSSLLDFSGRDTRRQFWPYAILLLLLGGAAITLVYIPAVTNGYLRLLDYAATHPQPGIAPDASSYEVFTDLNRPELRPYYGRFILSLCVIGLVHLALVAAALARRRHARDWSEATGALILPAVALTMAFASSTLPLLLGLFSLGIPLYALIRGGAPERIGGAIFLVGLFFYLAVVVVSPPMDFRGVEPKIFVVDLLGFLAMLLLALRSNRLWPIWLVAFMGLGMLAHVAAMVGDVPPWVYLIAYSIWAYPMLVVLLVGVRAHRIRLARAGSDPPWATRRAAAKDAA